MIRRFPLLTPVLFTVALGACNHEVAVERAMRVKFDPALGQAERRVLVQDMYSLMTQRLKTGRGSRFEQVFEQRGQRGTLGVIDYIDERINYLISSSSPVSSSLRWTDWQVAAVSNAQTVADNLGVTLWIMQEAARPSQLAFALGNASIPLLSSRVGLVRIGSAYPSFSRNVRLATLVHEARHSDCTGGLSREQLDRYRSGKGLLPDACGHLHARCPKGHEYEGLMACDALPWGAYSVEAVYSGALAKNCWNCTRRDKQLYRMLELETLSRVLVYEEMARGELGNPDMSSSGMVLSEVRQSLQTFRQEREANANTDAD